MKRKLFVCIFMLLLFLDSTFVLAATREVTYWKELSSKDKYKEWNIEFNYSLNSKTVDYDNIELSNERGIVYTNDYYNLSLNKGNKVLIVTPTISSGYETGVKYFIRIKTGVRSSNNLTMKNELVIPFVIVPDNGGSDISI